MRKLISHFARSGRKRCRDANVYPGGSALSDTSRRKTDSPLSSSKKGRKKNNEQTVEKTWNGGTARGARPPLHRTGMQEGDFEHVLYFNDSSYERNVCARFTEPCFLKIRSAPTIPGSGGVRDIMSLRGDNGDLQRNRWSDRAHGRRGTMICDETTPALSPSTRTTP